MKETRMLKKEIDLLRSLQNRHKNIIQIINLKDEDRCEHPILVMHYYPHTIYDAIMRRKARIPDTFYDDTAGALTYLQQNNILHNDIKPENILLTYKGEPILADFGFAQYGPEAKPKDLMGTPGYISPEMKSRFKTHGFKSDQWSLTIVWFEVLFRQDLFTDEMMHKLYQTDENSISGKRRTPENVKSHISHQLDFIETRLREVTKKRPDLYAFFKRATQKDPEERPSLPELLTSIKGLVS